MIKGTPRDYQEKGIQFFVNNRRIILADEPGLGKTLQVLGTLDEIGYGKTLIVCPKMALGVWEYEIRKWTDEIGLIYDGTIAQRRKLWKSFTEDASISFLITNYAKLEEIHKLKPHWTTIVCDEYHMAGLRNHKTQTYKRVKQLKSTNMALVTGTPVNRGPQDLYAPLSLLDPSEFDSYWKFENKHCLVVPGNFGQRIIEERPKNPVEFRAMWSKYMIHRKKNTVSGLPDKQRQMVPLEMSSKQAKLYRELETEMMLEIKQMDKMDASVDDFIITPGRMSLILRLRQLLVTPQLLGIDEKGACLSVLPEMLESEFEYGTPVVLFTPFAEALPYIKQEAARVANHVWIVQGGLSGVELHKRTEAFQNHKDVKRVLICTIKTAASFTVHAASTAKFIGYEWSAIDNTQAEDRIHRLGQTKQVRIEYLMHKGTVDDLVMEKLDSKQNAANFILNPREIFGHADPS